MHAYETRIYVLEDKIKGKCDKEEVKKIVHNEIADLKATGASPITADNTQSGKASFESVMSEMNSRKSRENNIVIYGIKEVESEISSVRRNKDIDTAKDILKLCKVKATDDTVSRTSRLGKFNKPTEETTTTETQQNPTHFEENSASGKEQTSSSPGRPLLVVFSSLETKLELFRSVSKLRLAEGYQDVRIKNDLTWTEREQEKKLRLEAKAKQDQSSGDFLFRVKGPPWARRVVRIPVWSENK
jgi:hypothetical protein